MLRIALKTIFLWATCLLSMTAGATIVSDWNNTALAEVRVAKFGPPIVARALAIAHTCMYDAWAPYDQYAIGAVVRSVVRRPAIERTDANKAEAISFAAYRCLLNLFPDGATRLNSAMQAHGYDPLDVSTDVTTPQGIGNFVASAVIANRRNDGSNQYGDLAPGAYSDYTGYAPVNSPMAFCQPQTAGPCPPNIADPYRWQPLISSSGVTQVAIGPHWEKVKPFALKSASQYDATTPPPNYSQGPANYLALLVCRASMTGMVVFDYEDRYPEAVAQLAEWLDAGKLTHREHVVDGGVHDFPAVLRKLFAGENTGKLVLKT